MLVECAGCGGHNYDSRWTFNGNLDKPTFSPSYSVKWTQNGVAQHCHTYLTDGVMHYLGDCTHKLVNQKIVVTRSQVHTRE